jgi:hypothetical protein
LKAILPPVRVLIILGSPFTLFLLRTLSFAIRKYQAMKKILILLIVVAGLASCKMSDKKGPATEAVTSVTTIKWLDGDPLNLGEVTDGQLVEVIFHFKNTGNGPLVIEKVTPGCGCTDAEAPKGAIAPGQEGEVKAKFNSAGYKGRMASKSLTVVANTEPKEHTLTFTVQVK